MTWYYMPFTSAPATAASSLPSETHPAPFVTLSGTPTQRPLSWPGWARRDWIKLLCGLTCAPSTLARGLAAWTSSLPVSPVSRSPRPGSAPELTMTVGSGQTSAGSSVRFDPVTCSWRTCQVLFDMDYPMSSLTLPPSGSMRNGVCSPRPTLAPLIDANDSGSWPTPCANTDSRSATASPAAFARGFAGTLTDAVRMWPSPLERDSKGEGFDNTNLPNTVRLWGTPVARDDQKSPEAHMAMKVRMDRNTATSLTVQAKMWGTPRASDAARGSDPIRTNDKAGSPTLKSQSIAFPHDPTTTAGGSNGMVLNPRFVAALMGLPDGWLTASTSAETASCPNAPERPGCNSPHDWGADA